MKTILIAACALLLSGCTTAVITIANLPTRFSDHKIVTNISYGSKPAQLLDIYIPKAKLDRKRPVIVFFYGGRWQSGTKDMYAFVGDAFADKGYITVIADYRKYPAVRFPTFVTDGAKAVAWTYDHIARYGGDPANLYIAGHSSGAHIGALIAADERYLQREGKSPSIVKAFAGLAGPYDFVPKAIDLKDIFGPPAQYPQMQVPTFIDGSEPPMLLLWGQDDETVLQRNIDLLAKSIRNHQGQVETQIYKGIDHVGIVASLTWYFEHNRPVLTDVVTFFEKHYKLN